MSCSSGWRLRPSNPSLTAKIAHGCGVSPLLAHLLVNRGLVDTTAADEFLNPALSRLYDPGLLCGMEKAVDRLSKAIINREAVCVYGDYDVDGVTALCVVVEILTELGAATSYYVPKRDDGYGLSKAGLDRALELGAQVLVTVDCGITANDSADYARSIGLDLIISDHHTPGPTLPDAVAVINPLIPDSLYPYQELAGVGVAFNLMLGLRKRLRELGFFTNRNEPNLAKCLDLVALGTIADVMPLTGINRTLVTAGLKYLSSANRPGVSALKDLTAIKDAVKSSHVGFSLSPRLNAAGRLADATISVQLLLEKDPLKTATLSARLDELNNTRRAMVDAACEDAVTLLDTGVCDPNLPCIVVASEKWHAGIIGIVAARLVDRYHKPAYVVAIDKAGKGKGSGRSVPGLDLLEATVRCRECLAAYGGHAQAAGITIPKEQLPRFTLLLSNAIQELSPTSRLEPVLLLEREITLQELSLETYRELQRMEPHGKDNPVPVFLIKNLDILEKKLIKKKHIQLTLGANGHKIKAVAFNQPERFELLQGCIDVAATMELDTWHDRTSIQLHIKDFRTSTVNCK